MSATKKFLSFLHKNGYDAEKKSEYHIRIEPCHNFYPTTMKYHNDDSGETTEMPENILNATIFIEFLEDKPGFPQSNEVFELVKTKETYDKHGSASHYDDQRINVIHQMEAVWGTHAVMIWCEITAFKYRMRIGKKDNPSLELKKIKWYETMAKYLKDKQEPNRITGMSSAEDISLPNEFLNMLEND